MCLVDFLYLPSNLSKRIENSKNKSFCFVFFELRGIIAIKNLVKRQMLLPLQGYFGKSDAFDYVSRLMMTGSGV